ncbi:TPA: ABC transporter ATP-binding protein [Streptococcus equi subsp. zooepidemicus]|nr:ABC transporter ATP-binding protein [Streptococcus equi subsp. zooepidemicus]
MRHEQGLISVEDLSFTYRDRLILDRLSFTIPKGKITTIMGANGCGKSTLLGLLTKNIPVKSGQIFLEGQAISSISLKQFAKKVAVVHQDNQAVADLLVGDLVAMARQAHRRFFKGSSQKDDDIVAWALEVTNLRELAFREMQELSGGEKQRVWIAMALAQKTGVLVLDEPTTYLDIKYQLDILALIKKINQELGMTIIMVLHDINQALAVSDCVLGLQKGTIYAQGSPQEVLDQAFVEAVFGVSLPFIEKQDRRFVLTTL